MGALAALEAERAPAAGRVPLQPRRSSRSPRRCAARPRVLGVARSRVRRAARGSRQRPCHRRRGRVALGARRLADERARRRPNGTVAAGALALAAPMDALPDVWVGADHQSILWASSSRRRSRVRSPRSRWRWTKRTRRRSPSRSAPPSSAARCCSLPTTPTTPTTAARGASRTRTVRRSASTTRGRAPSGSGAWRAGARRSRRRGGARCAAR